MRKLKGIISGIILCFGMLILAACGGKSSGITANDVDMRVQTINKNSATIKLTFTENENITKGLATFYVMAYKYVDKEETAGTRQDVKFTGDVYTSSTVSFSGLTQDQEYHFVLFLTFNKKSKKIKTVESSTSSYVSEEIKTVDDFKENLVNDTDGDFVLTEDLDFSIDGEAQTLNLFTSESKAFMGTLDGQGHTIKNFKLGTGTYTGLFGYLKGATIKNLVIENVTADYSSKSTSNIGALAGYAINSEIENVTINNVTFTISASSSAEHFTGGVVGLTTRSSYSNVVANNVNIDYTSAKIKINVGLFAGKIKGDALNDDITCKECGVTGNLSLISEYTASSSDAGYIYAGGFVGSLNSSGAIEDCYTDATVVYSTKKQNGRTYNLYLGGFVGANGPDSTMMYIKNCLASLDVSCYAGSISDDPDFNYDTYNTDYFLATDMAYLGGFIGKANGSFRKICDSYVLFREYPITLYADATRDTKETNPDTGEEEITKTDDVLFAGDFYGQYTGDDVDTYLPDNANHILFASSITENDIPAGFTDTQKEIIRQYISD